MGKRGRKRGRERGASPKPRRAASAVMVAPHRSAPTGDYDRWERDRERALKGPRKYPVVRLTETGPDWGVAPGSGDEVGYAMDPWRYDDCFTAAIATCIQVPVQQVPNLELDKKLAAGADPDELSRDAWRRIAEFADGRGLALVAHDVVPVARRRWIGVCVAPGFDGAVDHLGVDAAVAAFETTFQDHCLVMAHDRILFDPSCSVVRPTGFDISDYDLTDITYGLSFDRKE